MIGKGRKKPTKTGHIRTEESLKAVFLQDLGPFSDLRLDLSPGLNVLTGMNGTGKSHFLKFVHAGLTAPPETELSSHFSSLLLNPGDFATFLLHRPTTSREGRLMFKGTKGGMREFVVIKGKGKVGPSVLEGKAPERSGDLRTKSIFSFPEERGSWELFGGKPRSYRSVLVRQIEKAVPGRVCCRNGSLWIKNARGWSRWGQVSPATRQLGLLSLFLRQGALVPGSILLWDSPEGEFGPLLLGELVSLLLSLSRNGIQVVVATRDYVFLKEVDLRQTDEDGVRYHVFFRDDRQDKICAESSSRLSELSRNPASDALRSLLDRDIERAMDRRWSH